MFGWSKRERADRETKEIITWILGQSIAHGSNFPPVGVFETRCQMTIALEACAFFLHAVDRLAYRVDDERLREALYDITTGKMVRTFSDMISKAWVPSPPSKIEQDIINLFNTRQLEYGNAVSLIGENFTDPKSASWLAAHNVGSAAEIAERDIRRRLALHTELVKSLVVMDLANRIKKVEGYIR
jgi:hypothetical protein